jgi:hypothetical protein
MAERLSTSESRLTRAADPMISEPTVARARHGRPHGVPTVQEWEQGRRQPSGAARSLLLIAARWPEVLREVFAE